MGFSSKFNLTVMYPSVVSAMSSPGLMTLVSCVVSNVQVCGGGLWKNCALPLMQNGAYGQPFLLQEGGMGDEGILRICSLIEKMMKESKGNC